MIDLGGVYRIRVPITLDGEPVEPASAQLVVTLPDGDTETLDVPLPPAKPGLLVVDFPTTQEGRHGYVLTTTGPQTAYRDVFDVRAADRTLIVSLSDVRRHLNITNRAEDDELRSFTEAASAIVEAHVGSVADRSYTETHTVRARDSQISLRHWPVRHVTSADRDGSPVDPDGLVVVDFGRIRLAGGGAMTGTWAITYQVGRAIVSANITSAVLVIVEHLWETQRPRNSRYRPPGSSMSSEMVNVPDGRGSFYSIPRKALELIETEMVRAVA